MAWPRLLHALNARNYRLFFFGQLISLVGTWMTQTASLWLIYQLSSSAFLLGAIGFASQVPIFFLAPVAGVLADRMSRHRLLLLTQIASMLQSLALAILTWTHQINVHWLIALALVQGIINGVDIPVRQALVVAFVESREQLSNAIALNSSMFNLARLVGPAVAGFVIAGIGAAGCYAVDAASYLAVIVSLLAMKIATLEAPQEKKHPLVDLREGFHYAFSFPPIRALITTLALISFVGFSYAVLTPMFARDIFHGDSRTLGTMMSATGIGALIGATYLGSRSQIRGLGNVMTFGATTMGVGLIAFANSRWLPFSIFTLVLIGMGGVLMMASNNTVIQTLVEEAKRGRVMALYTMAFTGTMPLGNLLVGYIAGEIGPTLVLTVSGIICVIVATLFFRQLPQLRAAAAPIMERLEP